MKNYHGKQYDYHFRKVYLNNESRRGEIEKRKEFYTKFGFKDVKFLTRKFNNNKYIRLHIYYNL